MSQADVAPWISILKAVDSVRTPIGLAALVLIILFLLYRMIFANLRLDRVRSSEVATIVSRSMTLLFWIAITALVVSILSYVLLRIFDTTETSVNDSIRQLRPGDAAAAFGAVQALRGIRALRSLRAQALFKTGVRGYFRPLKYSSTDRRRIDFAQRAIRLFSQQSDMYISMVCAGAMPWPNSAVGKDAVQIQMYQRMLAQIRPTFRNHLTLHVIRRTRNGRDLALLNTVQDNVSFVNSIERAASTDLIALASLIVGSINAANAGQSRLVTDDTKLQLQSDLRGALGVGALRPTQLNQTGKVRVLKLA